MTWFRTETTTQKMHHPDKRRPFHGRRRCDSEVMQRHVKDDAQQEHPALFPHSLPASLIAVDFYPQTRHDGSGSRTKWILHHRLSSPGFPYWNSPVGAHAGSSLNPQRGSLFYRHLIVHLEWRSICLPTSLIAPDVSVDTWCRRDTEQDSAALIWIATH